MTDAEYMECLDVFLRGAFVVSEEVLQPERTIFETAGRMLSDSGNRAVEAHVKRVLHELAIADALDSDESVVEGEEATT